MGLIWQPNSLIIDKDKINLAAFKRMIRQHKPDLKGVWQLKRLTLKEYCEDYEIHGNGESEPYQFILKSVLLHQQKRKIQKKKK